MSGSNRAADEGSVFEWRKGDKGRTERREGKEGKESERAGVWGPCAPCCALFYRYLFEKCEPDKESRSHWQRVGCEL